MRTALLLALACSSVSSITFSAREIAGVNVMELPLAKTLIQCGTGSMTSCPNIAAFESAEASSTISSTTSSPSLKGSADIVNEGDVIASVISTIGGPSNVLSYYSEKSSLNLDLSSVTAVGKLISGGLSSVFSASGSVEFMSYIIDEVIEFKSQDGSGVFKANDTIVSRVYYATDPSIVWNPMSMTIVNDVTILNATTTNGQHSYQWSMSKEFAILENGAVLSPNSTKLDVKIKYPFKAIDGSSNLALRMIYFSASAAGAYQSKLNLTSQDVKSSSGNTYLSWVGKAESNLGLVNVQASAGEDLDAGYLNTATNLLTTVKGVVQAAGAADVKLSVSYYSFAVNSNHDFLFWDPSIGYGINPVDPSINSSGLSAFAIAGIVVACVVILGGVTFFIVKRHQRIVNKKGEPLLSRSV